VSGIHTIEDLKLRCVVDELTGCWHWKSGVTSAGMPSFWFPPIGRYTTAGVALCWFATGKEPRPGKVWHRTCDSLDCCNPSHRKEGTRKSQMLNAAITRTPLQKARIAMTHRSKSKLSEEAVQEIRESSEPLKVMAEKYSIDLSHAARIRNMQARKPIGGASIFNLGG